MTDTTTIEGAPLRVIVVGAGNMGRRWLSTAEESGAFEVVGLVDINADGARSAADGIGRSNLPIATSLGAMLDMVETDAVANVTIPSAHHAVSSQSLLAGIPVVSEKPAAATLAESLSLAAASEVAGKLLVISQSRRHNPKLQALKERSAGLGRVGIAVTEFFRAPRFGGFRDEMEHPLLVDMAIHPFDSARYLLDAEPVSVYCEEYNPSWSWYRGDAAATAIFEMTDGVRFVYTASWASPGLETSWNGRWRISAEHGSAEWDGDTSPRSEPEVDESGIAMEYEGVSASMHAFAAAVHSGTTPSGEVHENILSLAMVEAAVVSSGVGARVRIDDVLERAREEAIAAETVPIVREALAAWGPAGEHLRAHVGRSVSVA